MRKGLARPQAPDSITSSHRREPLPPPVTASEQQCWPQSCCPKVPGPRLTLVFCCCLLPASRGECLPNAAVSMGPRNPGKAFGGRQRGWAPRAVWLDTARDSFRCRPDRILRCRCMSFILSLVDLPPRRFCRRTPAGILDAKGHQKRKPLEKNDRGPTFEPQLPIGEPCMPCSLGLSEASHARLAASLVPGREGGQITAIHGV
jgi:hypothetical protein